MSTQSSTIQTCSDATNEERARKEWIKICEDANLEFIDEYVTQMTGKPISAKDKLELIQEHGMYSDASFEGYLWCVRKTRGLRYVALASSSHEERMRDAVDIFELLEWDDDGIVESLEDESFLREFENWRERGEEDEEDDDDHKE